MDVSGATLYDHRLMQYRACLWDQIPQIVFGKFISSDLRSLHYHIESGNWVYGRRFLLRNMATSSISILLPQHPTFEKVVMYFHKVHLNSVEHQGPISYCIQFIWAAVKCYASTRSKLKWESWASGEAQAHRFKQGTNITSTSRLWLLSPGSAEESRIQYPRENSQEGQSMMLTEPCTVCCSLEQMGARDWKPYNDSSEHLLSVPLSFSSSPPPLFLSWFVRLKTYFHGPFNQNLKLKASQREWTLHFAKDLSLSCSTILKNQILFPLWWLP